MGRENPICGKVKTSEERNLGYTNIYEMDRREACEQKGKQRTKKGRGVKEAKEGECSRKPDLPTAASDDAKTSGKISI